jgi:hypothetical protein
VEEIASIERELLRLDAELKQLEAEYNMYFSGRLPRPPSATRSRVAALVKRCDRAYIANYGDRFRFATLQSRFATLTDLWDRGLRAREEGRPGPFAPSQRNQPLAAEKGQDRILRVTTFKDPVREIDRLQDLYESLAEARREAGQDVVPFHKFAELVKNQVKDLRRRGTHEVAFRVMVKGGKVSFTARALKGAESPTEK